MTAKRSSGVSGGSAARGSRRGLRVAVPAAAALLVAGGLSIWSFPPKEASAAEGKATAADDFNGDGFADLVSGAPGGTISGKAGAGYVAVNYGSADGISHSEKKLVSRSTSGVPGSAAAQENFGTTFSRGDLDGDGYGDLVIGSEKGSAGAVIMWGSPSGLTGGTKVDGFGKTPQVGDFDGDGKADLALFGDSEVGGDDPEAQQANLWKGPISREGTPSKKLDFMHESEWSGYEDDCNATDECIDGPHSVSGPTVAKAVGDVNGDGNDDIAVHDYEGDGVYANHLLLGGAEGFKRSGEVGNWAASGDESAMDIGDIDGDGYDDVVVGANDSTNKVTVARGSADGTSEAEEFDQSLTGFPGEQVKGDLFGSCVAVDDIDGDGRAEIALGISGKDVGGLTNAGAVGLLRGSSSGVTGEGSQLLHQDSKGIPGVAEKGDKFGSDCALLDTDGDGLRDLGVSAAGENASAGAVWALPGTASGLGQENVKSFGPGDINAPVTKALLGSSLG